MLSDALASLKTTYVAYNHRSRVYNQVMVGLPREGIFRLDQMDGD